MQNKPNLQNSQMVVNLAKTSNYNNEQRTMNYELLFKTNPIKPNCKPTTPFSKFPSKTPIFLIFLSFFLPFFISLYALMLLRTFL